MKNAIKVILLTLMLTMMMIVVGAAAADTEVKAATKSSRKTITVGNSAKLKLSVNGKWISYKKIKFKSSNKKVVKVKKGFAIARKTGKATVTAVCKGVKFKWKIKVKKRKKVSLTVGQQLPIKINVEGKNVASKKVKWKSSNKKVAAISKKGILTAKKAGKTIVSAKYKGYMLNWEINVKAGAKGNDVVTVPKSTRAQNYNKVKDYINKNGSFNLNGNKFVTYEDEGITVEIENDTQNRRLNFLFTYTATTSKSGITLTLTVESKLSVSESDENNANIIVTMADSTNTVKYMMQSNIYIPTYNNSQTINFTETVLQGFTSQSSQETANGIFDVSMELWDIYMQSITGVNLKGLGFKAY